MLKKTNTNTLKIPFSKINVYNLDYPVHPAAIVRPKTVQQVSAAVNCAVKAGVKVQPRSGGHSFANYSLGGVDGALVVDLVYFQKFEMDTATWRSRNFTWRRYQASA